jgi:hypothetical protein
MMKLSADEQTIQIIAATNVILAAPGEASSASVPNLR